MQNNALYTAQSRLSSLILAASILLYSPVAIFASRFNSPRNKCTTAEVGMIALIPEAIRSLVVASSRCKLAT